MNPIMALVGFLVLGLMLLRPLLADRSARQRRETQVLPGR